MHAGGETVGETTEQSVSNNSWDKLKEVRFAGGFHELIFGTPCGII